MPRDPIASAPPARAGLELPEDRLREAIRAEVTAIVPFDAREREHQAEALAWIDSGAELCRRIKPATPPQHLVSYLVCLAEGHLLLVDHLSAQLWLPPGGHVDPGEHPRETVRRETREELGIEADFLREAPLMVTLTETVGLCPGHVDVVLWYLLRGDRRGRVVFEEPEFVGVGWFAFPDVRLKRGEPHLERFFGKVREWK